MNDQISNIASVAGTFDSLPTSLTSEAIVTPMSSDLTITKTADKLMWADGNLTYTITVKNENATTAYESVILTDVIDISKAVLVENSITLDGTTVAYTYDDVSGTLTVSIEEVAANSSSVVVFQIAKV